jgi:hypothetical protein
MNFTILGPSDNPVQNSKSDTTDGNFGGNREYSQTADAKDYTKRTGTASNKKENPVDITTKDIDDMADPNARKREFSYQENKEDVQKNNESGFITKSDSDNRPRMDEGSDAVQVPTSSDLRQRKKPNRWQFDSSDTYEGEIS